MRTLIVAFYLLLSGIWGSINKGFKIEEIHLVIIWSKGLVKKQEILKDLKCKYEVLEIYDISWSSDNFSNNLSRFYGEYLHPNSKKELHCGNGTFCCIILKDNKPAYASRKTSKGLKVVNTNLFDSKQIYRSWTNGGHKVHATDNILETKTQLALLFGKNYDDYIIKNGREIVEEIDYKYDLIGSNGWKSFDDLFRVLNYTAKYVVLRNFDNLEDQFNSEHPDVDILVENKSLVRDILNAKKTSNIDNRVQHKDINFDIRYIGDNYYDKFWEGNIIRTRKFHRKGFYIPNDKNHFYSLIYHALIHKKNVSDDYNRKFQELGNDIGFEIKSIKLVENELLNILFKFLEDNRYEYVEPKDLTVYYNDQLINTVCRVEVSEKRKEAWSKLKFKAKILKELKRILKQINSLLKKK